jgi:hypothetical protein
MRRFTNNLNETEGRGYPCFAETTAFFAMEGIKKKGKCG